MDANRPAYPPTAAVVLAGGRATRMGGGDKCRIPVGGRPVILRILDALVPQVAGLALNANGDAGRFRDLAVPVVADGVPGQPGPLAGVLAGLDWAARCGWEWLVTVPGDGPFLPNDLVARLHAVRDGAGFACAGSGGRRHPVTALWPVGCRTALRAALERGERRVQAFTGTVPMAVWDAAGRDPFANLNTPADVLEAGAAVP